MIIFFSYLYICLKYTLQVVYHPFETNIIQKILQLRRTTFVSVNRYTSVAVWILDRYEPGYIYKLKQYPVLLLGGTSVSLSQSNVDSGYQHSIG